MSVCSSRSWGRPRQDMGCHHSNLESKFTGISSSAAPPYLLLRQGIENKNENKMNFLHVFKNARSENLIVLFKTKL